MYFNTLSQGYIALILATIGFLCGIIYNLSRATTMIFGGSAVIRFILDFLATLISFGVLYLSINILYFGWIRPYMLAAFFLGMYFELITVGKLFANTFKMLYNKIAKLWGKFLNTRFGKRLAK